MAFVCTVKGESFSVEVFRTGNATSIVVPVGYDDQSTRGYAAVVGLDPMAGGNLEYWFHLIETDSCTDYEYVYWCGKDVSIFVGDEDRKCILDVILAMTKELIGITLPQEIHCCTYDSNPPDKALVKFSLIFQVFEECGYEVHTADAYHGKRVWWMERK